MKIEWFRSATVGIQTNSGTSVLCDPWISNGAFIGSWFHFPKLEGFEFQELVSRKWNFLYISHLHADHFDRKLVSAIAKAHPDCRVILPNFDKKWLYRAIKNCGFNESRLIELDSGKTAKLLDLDVTVYLADFCDPQICGSSIPCFSASSRERAIDSLALFEADGQRVLNANDALAVESTRKLWQKIGKIDLLLGHYGGAGPYPQCFDLSTESKVHESNILAQKFLTNLADASNRLNSTYVMPYAGQYLLGGELSSLNNFRSVVPLSTALGYLESNSISTPISMSPFTVFNLDTGSGQIPWEEPSRESIVEYVNSISESKYPYQLKEENWDVGEASLTAALNNVKRHYENNLESSQLRTQHSVTLDCGNFSKTLNFDLNRTWISDGQAFDAETKISLDHRLLKRIITRSAGYSGFTQYHFNQAEIGSHMKWSREGSYNPVIRLLNFMHAEL